jgi:hypothetical protein
MRMAMFADRAAKRYGGELLGTLLRRSAVPMIARIAMVDACAGTSLATNQPAAVHWLLNTARFRWP